ncbi:hypothetical protein [Sporosalibacterium faouarense]|nr:hypothetical protein [Sporosalibacterium faouarense]
MKIKRLILSLLLIASLTLSTMSFVAAEQIDPTPMTCESIKIPLEIK